MPTNTDNFQFSSEIKDLITSIKNEREWKILEFLIQNNNELSFTKIKDHLGISNTEKFKLTYALKELVKGGWLRNQYRKAKGITREKSFYSISDFGLKMIEGSIKATQIESYSTNVWNQLIQTTQEERIPVIAHAHVFLNEPSSGNIPLRNVATNIASTVFFVSSEHQISVIVPRREQNRKETRISTWN